MDVIQLGRTAGRIRPIGIGEKQLAGLSGVCCDVGRIDVVVRRAAGLNKIERVAGKGGLHPAQQSQKKERPRGQRNLPGLADGRRVGRGIVLGRIKLPPQHDKIFALDVWIKAVIGSLQCHCCGTQRDGIVNHIRRGATADV